MRCRGRLQRARIGVIADDATGGRDAVACAVLSLLDRANNPEKHAQTVIAVAHPTRRAHKPRRCRGDGADRAAADMLESDGAAEGGVDTGQFHIERGIAAHDLFAEGWKAVPLRQVIGAEA
jgi:hypothetical protein